MPHFLIDKNEIINSEFIELVENENLFHLTKVLRVKKGEKIKFIDSDKNLFFCEVVDVLKNFLKAKIIKKEFSQRFLKFNLCLIQSILAPDAQNLLIANAVQTGVQEIYPVISDNVSVSRKTLNDKVNKWNKIAQENFKQCERADMPVVCEISNLKDVLNNFKKENILIFAEKYENKTLNNCLLDIDLKEKIAVVVGPEGGFSQDEFEYFIKQEYKLISLGNLIYKAPNAVVAGISNIVSRIDNV